ncbi:MAG: short chain dehydrogenase [Desulfobacterales bacterium]|nr:short chain dehydrogenase [Desulfobacterales bacterium]
MKILMVGGNGTIGSKVRDHFSKKHTVITASPRSGDLHVDITDSSSIKDMFDKAGPVDALVSTAGEAKWAEFKDLTEQDFYIGIKSKLMGQVNLVRLGISHMNERGSFTLSTGILADHPVAMTTSAAMVNGAIHSFVKAACLELPPMRINVVSSGLVEDAVAHYESYFPGHTPIPMAKVVNAFVKGVEGAATGEIIRIYDNC